jgi:medium-chain acyl-[acyl-carrier-protein] hydrolase
VRGASKWILRTAEVRNVRLRLFCFPYAGGCAGVFQQWARSMPPGVELCSVQLPGRANRIKEPPLRDIPSIVSAIAQEIAVWLDQPAVFFGHSLGALIGFELARYLQMRQGAAPLELLVSGCRAPQIPGPLRKLHDLPDSEFMSALRNLGGTPEQILNEPRLIAFIAPYLRADLQAFETYDYVPGSQLACPISAFAGLNDPRAIVSDVWGWRNQTSSNFSLKTFPGDHFFLHASEEVFLTALRDALLRIMFPMHKEPAGVLAPFV